MKRSLTTIGWLVRDTLRQARASGICWLLLGISAVCILVCLTLAVEGSATLALDGEQPDFLPRADVDARDAEKLHSSGVMVAEGQLWLAFGAIELPIARDTQSAVRGIELALA